MVLNMMKFLPQKSLAKWCYKGIYKYDKKQNKYKWCYFITPAKFKQGIFDAEYFDTAEEIDFEGYKLFCPAKIKEYLAYRYGDYMTMPSEEKRKISIHAKIYDVEKNYTEYLK